MIGVALGIGSLYAVYVGFLLHMITSVVIGIIYSTITKYQKTIYHICLQRTWNWSPYRSSGLGGSFSPTELWNSATNVEQYAEYIEYYIF
jgi:4-hydroxybenzoate polyprenyltransferase